MKCVLSFVMLLVAAIGSAFSADPIHTINASRVLTSDGAPLTEWVIAYSLYTDIQPNGVVTLEKTFSVSKLKLDGVQYDPSNSSWTAAHNEVLQWCSLHWPVSIEVAKDGAANLIPLKGDEARKVYKMAGDENWKSPWEGTKWRHCGLTKLRELNREFDKTNPPQDDNSHLLGPAEEPRRLPPHAEKLLRDTPLGRSPHGRLAVPMNGRMRRFD